MASVLLQSVPADRTGPVRKARIAAEARRRNAWIRIR